MSYNDNNNSMVVPSNLSIYTTPTFNVGMVSPTYSDSELNFNIQYFNSNLMPTLSTSPSSSLSSSSYSIYSPDYSSNSNCNNNIMLNNNSCGNNLNSNPTISLPVCTSNPNNIPLPHQNDVDTKPQFSNTSHNSSPIPALCSLVEYGDGENSPDAVVTPTSILPFGQVFTSNDIMLSPTSTSCDLSGSIDSSIPDLSSSINSSDYSFKTYQFIDLSPTSPPSINSNDSYSPDCIVPNVQYQQLLQHHKQLEQQLQLQQLIGTQVNFDYNKYKNLLIKVVKRNLFEVKFSYPYSKVEEKAAILMGGDITAPENYHSFTRLILDVKIEYDNFIKRFNDSILYVFDSLSKDAQRQILYNAQSFLQDPTSIKSVRLSNEFETFLVSVVGNSRPLNRINQDVREYILNKVVKDGVSFSRKRIYNNSGKRKSCDFYYY